jgi:hypothetical protein
MMTLNRYLLVGKDHPKWLVTVAKMEFKWLIRGYLLISALFNIGHGWQYQAEEDTVISNPHTNIYDKINGNSYSDYPGANQEFSYFIYSIVYFFINFGIFFILNTGIEIKLVRRMHKELREKRDRQKRMNHAPNSSASLTKCQPSDEEMKIEEEDGKKERKVIKMVVLNGVLNFIFRAPDMLFWIENYKFWPTLMPKQSTMIIQTVSGILSFVVDISYFAYILTFTTNFLIFYNFNSKFKQAILQ